VGAHAQRDDLSAEFTMMTVLGFLSFEARIILLIAILCFVILGLFTWLVLLDE
jgi:hypothetical protein